jgi:hypothetical protein
MTRMYKITTNSNISIASQNNATVADRPYLEITYSSGAVLRLLAMTGVGV